MMELNLFGDPKPAAQSNALVIPQVEVVQSGLTKATEPIRRPAVSRTIALPIYEAAIEHLLNYDVPHFTPFRVKGTANRLKWCIDYGNPKTATNEAKPDMLTLYWETERQGQNLDKPDAMYTQWEVLYSRSLKPSTTPKAIGMKPRKARLARGSRSVSTKERDAS